MATVVSYVFGAVMLPHDRIRHNYGTETSVSVYITQQKYRTSTQIPLGSCSDSIYARFQGN